MRREEWGWWHSAHLLACRVNKKEMGADPSPILMRDNYVFRVSAPKPLSRPLLLLARIPIGSTSSLMRGCACASVCAHETRDTWIYALKVAVVLIGACRPLKIWAYRPPKT